MRKAGVVFFFIWMASTAIALADCRVHHGDHVVLYSTADDPSVLIWDSRARLRAYHGASFDEAQAMLSHSILVAPGTRAIVISCVAGYVVSPLFTGPDDAVGITISSGSQHGLTGWVLGTDVRSVSPPHH